MATQLVTTLVVLWTASPGNADPPPKEPTEARVRVEPSALDVVLLGPDLIPECPRARLRPVIAPALGAATRLPQGVVRYTPSASFWSVGGDTMGLKVRRCRGVRRLIVRFEAGAPEQISADVGLTDGGPPWRLTDPGRRIDIAETLVEAPLRLVILPGQTPATVDIGVPATADDGQANGGSLIAKIDVDDDGDPIDPTDPNHALDVVLWRATTADGTGGVVGQLSLRDGHFVLELDGVDGQRHGCSTPFRRGLGDVAVDWWHDPTDGGGRLRIDGVAACSVRGVANAGLVIGQHRLGDVDGSSIFSIVLDGLRLADGPTVDRRGLANRGDFGVASSWLGVPAAGWSAFTDRGGRTWAAVDSGAVFSLEMGDRDGLPWVVELALDPASSVTHEPTAVWRMVDERSADRLRLELERSIDGDRVRLVGLDALGATVVSDWQELSIGASRMVVQGRRGETTDLARLWIDGRAVAELEGIVLGSAVEQRYGLPESASGTLELGELAVFVDRP